MEIKFRDIEDYILQPERLSNDVRKKIENRVLRDSELRNYIQIEKSLLKKVSLESDKSELKYSDAPAKFTLKCWNYTAFSRISGNMMVASDPSVEKPVESATYSDIELGIIVRITFDYIKNTCKISCYQSDSSFKCSHLLLSINYIDQYVITDSNCKAKISLDYFDNYINWPETPLTVYRPIGNWSFNDTNQEDDYFTMKVYQEDGSFYMSITKKKVYLPDPKKAVIYSRDKSCRIISLDQSVYEKIRIDDNYPDEVYIYV